jgi:ribosomal protein S12 methylthiotransferase
LKKTDIVIINTCGFIDKAKQESVQVITDMCHLKKTKKIRKVYVVGCLAQRYKSELKGQMRLVDGFFGVTANEEIIRDLSGKDDFLSYYKRELLTPSHYAYLKISEGCSHSCSFCAIPFIRGKHISRPMEELVAEAENLVALGVKEINLIAQDTTYYGQDLYGRRCLEELLEKLSDVNNLKWLRLMYTYPTSFRTEVLKVMAERDNICKYIDIPLQHISDNVLSSMKRGMDKNKIIELLAQIRDIVPNVSIRSTFIVGYPNETEKDFSELYDFLNTAKLDRVGIFTYSHEDDTPAYELKDSISPKIKEERKDTLMKLQSQISLQKNKNKVGKILKVLIDEKVSSDTYLGRTEHDAPEVDNSVHIKSQQELKPGDFVEVKISEAEEYDLFGSLWK